MAATKRTTKKPSGNSKPHKASAKPNTTVAKSKSTVSGRVKKSPQSKRKTSVSTREAAPKTAKRKPSSAARVSSKATTSKVTKKPGAKHTKTPVKQATRKRASNAAKKTGVTRSTPKSKRSVSSANRKAVVKKSKPAAATLKSSNTSVAASDTQATKANHSGPKMRSLYVLNFVASIAHFAQAVLVMLFAIDSSRLLTISHLSENQGSLRPDSMDVFYVEIAPLVALFFMISGFSHLYVSILARKHYRSELERGRNTYRWIEYSTSASLMMVLIAILTGIHDIGLLAALFGLVAVMNLCGMVMESCNNNKESIDWLPFKVGALAGAVPWIVVGLSLWAAESASSFTQVPSFVYGIYASLFLLFNCFAVNMWLQYKKIGPWANYLFGEKVYIWLSLIAKTALAWQIYFGALQP